MIKQIIISSIAVTFAGACSTTAPLATPADSGSTPSFYASSSKNILAAALSEEAFILKSNYGTNIGLFRTSTGVVLIDPMPGSDNLSDLNNSVKSLTGESARFILNTHEHDDHSGGNAFFIEKGATLLDNTSSLLEFQQITAKSHANEDRVFFHRESNSIFVGDIYDAYWHPTFYAGGPSGFNNAIEAILKLGDDGSIIVPGHGKPTSKAELREFRKSTLDWVSRVKELKNNGMADSDIKNDSQILIILDRFNAERRVDFIPENVLVRFIERTLAVIERDM